MDTIFRMCWTDPQYNAALKVCMDLKIFEALESKSGFVPVVELAQSTGADASLLRRLLRHLAAMGALQEQEPDSYRSTALARAILLNEVSSGPDFWFNVASPVFSTLPSFLAKTGYKVPSNPANAPWLLAKDTTDTFYEYLNKHLNDMASFANHMSGYSLDRGYWTEIYPIGRITENAVGHAPLIVDIGGGQAQDMIKLKGQLNLHPGSLVVQDLPVVIEQAKGKVEEDITLMVHDVFTTQPVKGLVFAESYQGNITNFSSYTL